MKSIALVVALLLPACICEEGSGVLVQESRSVDGFSALEIDVPASLQFTIGALAPIKIRTDDNLIDHITTSTDGDALRIATDETCCIDPTELTIQISAPSLDAISIDGAVDVDIGGELELDRLSIRIDGAATLSAPALSVTTLSLEIDGAAEADIGVNAGRIETTIDGAAVIAIAGTAAEHEVSIDGAAELKGRDLATAVTVLDIDGVASAQVRAESRLEVDIDGAASVRYCGDPSITERIDGAGSLRASDDC